MWENVVRLQPDRYQLTVWRMRVACWITKATDTLRICNTALPRQRCFLEGTSMLRLHVHCPSCYHHHRCFYYLISKHIIIIIITVFIITVSVLPGYWFTSAEFDFWRRQALFSFLHLLNRLWGAHPVTYSVGNRDKATRACRRPRTSS